MAKITGPLLSMGGSGQIGKTVVFGNWRGIDYARQYVIPANPNSAGQSLSRSTFAMLREMWKLNPTIGREPWSAFATGRKFLNLNAYVGENIRVIRGEVDMNLFIGSPGARGGLPAAAMVAATGAGSGEVTATFTAPGAPTGWILVAAQAVAFPDQDPADDFVGPLVAAEDLATPWVVTLTGLGSAVACQVAGWLKWTKPNGDTAYSVGITDQATSGT